jgi:putative peptidoglycan lipid II flippase
MVHKETMTRRAVVVSLGTMASRILGLVRDMVIAVMFDSSMRDIFFFAYRIPNLFRRLLGEGALSAAFIPVFNEYLAKEEEKKALRTANTIFRLLFIILVIFTVIGILAAPLIVRPTGFETEAKLLALGLLRAMFPFVIFICLAALIMGILNSFGNFGVPAFAPAIFNLVIITSVFIMCSRLRCPVIGLAAGVILGGAGQLLFQMPFAVKKGLFRFPRLAYNDAVVKKVGLLFLPAAFGLAITPINTLVDTLLASRLLAGSVSALWYSNRLFQLPLALFGVAIATAIFPTMSRQASRKKIEELKETLSHALNLAFFTTIPASIGLVILRVPIIRLLFQYKKFTSYDTSATAWALVFYCLGIFAFASVIILVRVFYSLKDTKTPAWVAGYAVGANIILDLILMRPLAQGGLALATSLVAILHMFFLFWLLRKRIGRLGGSRIFLNFIRILGASSIMGLVCWLVTAAFEPYVVQVGFRVLQVGITIAAGLVTLAVASAILRVKEMRTLWAIVTGKRAR